MSKTASWKKGCLDSTFSLKMALQTRKEFNLNTWVVFVDLVKSFDTVNRDMLIKIIALFGLPEHLINVICHLYKPVRMKFKSGKQIHEFLNLVGVKQGDNLAPVLFLFVMQTAQESLERVWMEHNIVLPSFTWLLDNEDGTSNGTLTGQRSNKPGKFFEFPPHSMQMMELSCSLQERARSQAQAYFTPISSILECLCMWNHMQLNLVKAASLRLKQYISPVEIHPY